MTHTGLTQEEVLSRVAENKVNRIQDRRGKTIGQIILGNTLTFFNLLNLAFFVLIMMVGSYKNGTFMMVILINTVIGIIQEIRTKKTLDSMAILTASRVTVIRGGQESRIEVTDLVLDDVMVLRTGDQIPADAMVLSGEIECNESLLTGESDNIMKTPGAEVFSGSFVTSGEAVLRVIHVGKDNYIETIAGEAKKFKQAKSQLKISINKILRLVGFCIVPLTAGIFLKAYYGAHETMRSAVEQMVTSGVGMIPEGLVLLTSIALTLGVLRLAKKRTIVQDLYCIETLARVDVLCLDKTGTLTEGRIKVENSYQIDLNADLREPFQNLLSAQGSGNATSQGLLAYYGRAERPWTPVTVIPFSSDRKYSGASFEGHGTYYMGALQFLFPDRPDLEKLILPYAEEGLRVIMLAKSDRMAEDYSLPDDLRPLGYVIMSDVIRRDCQKTLNYFRNQGVTLKCISGDDPLTVSKIAKKCGLENADSYVDCSTIGSTEEMLEASRKYTVFGRVKPDQKKLLVECLQHDGHTVAMTGDGVNDVLALKAADCSIAMASGSEATKHTANIVLLDSDFSSMPMVMREGRRVINNICNAAAMYLIKTTFSVLLAIGTLIIGRAYPFQAVQITLISAFAVGAPTFFLQMEPSFKPIKDNFMQQVFRNSVPGGIVIAISTLLISYIGRLADAEPFMLSTICVLVIGFVHFYMLKRVYSPLSTYRKIVCYVMEILYLVAMSLGQSILDLTGINVVGVMVLIGLISITPMLIDLFENFYDRHLGERIQRMATREPKKLNLKGIFNKISDEAGEEQA